MLDLFTAALQPVQLFAGFLAIVAIVFSFVFLYFFNVWIRAFASKAKVGFASLIGMKLRQVPPSLIVDARIRLVKAGIAEVSIDQIESHYMAGGDVLNVVNALIAADKANINLVFQQAAAIDLAGRNVFDAVRLSVNPRVIDCTE